MKLSQIIDINAALFESSAALTEMQKNKDPDYDPKVSYAFAKNISILREHASYFREQNEIRILSFSQKNESGEPLIVDEKIIFGENKASADQAYKELLNKDFDVKLFTIARGNCTDKLSPEYMSILLDAIITE